MKASNCGLLQHNIATGTLTDLPGATPRASGLVWLPEMVGHLDELGSASSQDKQGPSTFNRTPGLFGHGSWAGPLDTLGGAAGNVGEAPWRGGRGTVSRCVGTLPGRGREAGTLGRDGGTLLKSARHLGRTFCQGIQWECFAGVGRHLPKWTWYPTAP
jgi:hypothetical protein